MKIIKQTLHLGVMLVSGIILTALPDQSAAAEGKIKIILIGDSTVQDSSGWGLGFRQFVDTNKVELINLARGGRSSMSFMREGRWTNALALHGDYYLIQFGHNNQPGKPGRSTDMPTFVANMRQYVDDARAIGATPVLVTPLTRREWDKSQPDKIKSSLAPYAAEVRQIAADQHVPLVDLQARSIELCESLGPEKCLQFSPFKTVNGKQVYDGTHLNPKGYVLFARLVVNELRTACPELAPVLLVEPAQANPLPVEVQYDEVVSPDGSGTQTTIQAAVAAAPTNGTKPFVILVKPARYQEQVVVPANHPLVELLGEPQELGNTIITGGLNVKSPGPNGKTLSARDSSTVLVQGSDFCAKNITFENTTTREDKVQALALYVEADRAVFRNCRFLGWQDTVRADAPRHGAGRQYFADCCIEGYVDFIYAAGTAVFNRCHLQVKADGYLTAASTPKNTPYGYVFLNCKITAGPEVQRGFYLGRPWRPYAAVAFLNCELPAQVRPEGWDNWGHPANELTARYAEYKSTGPGANPDARCKWSRQLTDAEAETYTLKNILGGADHWNPEMN